VHLWWVGLHIRLPSASATCVKVHTTVILGVELCLSATICPSSLHDFLLLVLHCPLPKFSCCLFLTNHLGGGLHHDTSAIGVGCKCNSRSEGRSGQETLRDGESQEWHCPSGHKDVTGVRQAQHRKDNTHLPPRERQHYESHRF
jgi:hypothetical protein